MDERDNTITATTAERPAPEETTETIERVPWGQQLAPVEPEASEVEEAGEEGEVTDGEGGELVETHDVDHAAEQILESPEFQAVLESRGHYADPSRYSLTPKFAEIASAEDRPLVEGFFKIIAEAQAGQAFADKLLNLVAENTIALREARLEQDTADHETIETVMHGEWGGDYQSNLDGLKEFIDGLALPARSDLQLGGIIGQVDLVDVVAEHASRWFVGPVGWVLKNPKPLPFQLCKGQLGLFRSGGRSSADVLPDEMP